jgi:hypothetical protein
VFGVAEFNSGAIAKRFATAPIVLAPLMRRWRASARTQVVKPILVKPGAGIRIPLSDLYLDEEEPMRREVRGSQSDAPVPRPAPLGQRRSRPLAPPSPSLRASSSLLGTLPDDLPPLRVDYRMPNTIYWEQVVARFAHRGPDSGRTRVSETDELVLEELALEGHTFRQLARAAFARGLHEQEIRRARLEPADLEERTALLCSRLAVAHG